jgi:hypothetical protein
MNLTCASLSVVGWKQQGQRLWVGMGCGNNRAIGASRDKLELDHPSLPEGSNELTVEFPLGGEQRSSHLPTPPATREDNKKFPVGHETTLSKLATPSLITYIYLFKKKKLIVYFYVFY